MCTAVTHSNFFQAKKALESHPDPDGDRDAAGPSHNIETKKWKKTKKRKHQTGSSELQQTEVAIGDVISDVAGVPVAADDPLAGLMEVVEEHPAPEQS